MYSAFEILVGVIAIIAAAIVAYLGLRRLWIRLPAKEIFVGNHRVGPSGYITVSSFPGSANGDIAPSSEFSVNHILAIARDRLGNIYLASDTANAVQVYAPGTTGVNPPPSRLRNIQGPATKLHRPSGLAVDGQDNLYVAERGGPDHPSALLKFAPGADGDIAPIATIPSRIPVAGQAGAVNTGLDIASGVAVGPNGSIYVVTCSELNRQGASKLLIFDPGTNGDVAPAVEVTMGLSEPQQVTLDRDGNIYITNRGANPTITIHASSPVTDVAPARTITSADLGQPCGIALDGDFKVFVAEPDQASILVFDALASGNVSPLRRIQGPSTGLSDPTSVAVRW